MDFPKKLSVSDIAETYSLRILGDSSLMANGINEIHKVREGDICFVDHPKYYDKTLRSAATIILIDQEYEVPEGKCLLICDDPFTVYNDLVLKYRPHRRLQSGIHPSVDIHPTAQVASGVTIGPDCTIGARSIIQPGVIIHEHCIIGEDCLVQSGTIIGSDAFYFKRTPEKSTKWRSGGRVILKDKVDIGANCTINRGVSGDTIIGEDTKIDCLVHVGHGVVIGARCLLAAQVGIAGKTVIGDDVTIYGQVGIAHGLHIESGTTILAQSGISKDLEKGNYFGTPAKNARTILKEYALRARLPEFYALLRKLSENQKK